MSIQFIQRHEILNLAKRKRIVGFGAGIFGVKTIAYTDNIFKYFVDNSQLKIGQPWDGTLEVRTVDSLKNEKIDSIVVIICSEAYLQIQNQLYELIPELEVYVSPLLKDHQVFTKLKESAENLVVSAYGAAGGLYLVNSKTEEYSCLKQGSFRGLVKYNGKTLAGNEDGDIIQIESVRPFKYSYIIKSNFKSQLHGMTYWKDENLLIVAEVAKDRLNFYDGDNFKLKETFYFSEQSKKNLSGLSTGIHHINDLLIVDDKLLFSMLSLSSFWKYGVYDGAIMSLNLANMQESPVPVIQNLLFPHSLLMENEILFFLESMTGKLLDGNKNLIIQFPGFVRGLSFENGLFYIGQSRNRRINDVKNYLKGISVDSGLYIADPDSTLYRFIKLPDMSDVYNVIPF